MKKEKKGKRRERNEKIGKSTCRIREIGVKGDKAVVVSRKKAVDYALEKIENGYRIAVKFSGGPVRLVESELLEAEILAPERKLEVLVIPPVKGGC